MLHQPLNFSVPPKVLVKVEEKKSHNFPITPHQKTKKTPTARASCHFSKENAYVHVFVLYDPGDGGEAEVSVREGNRRGWKNC